VPGVYKTGPGGDMPHRASMECCSHPALQEIGKQHHFRLPPIMQSSAEFIKLLATFRRERFSP
jgi:hypothetical protein